MKKFYFLSILISIFGYSQVIKDTIFGKPKYVKEYVVFLNESHPFTFMKGDNEYGHAVIMTPENLRKRMCKTWFETNFCRYINNETFYYENRKISREIWYYKSGEIVEDYSYNYDDLGRLKEKKSYNDRTTNKEVYFYDGNDKNASFKERTYKIKDGQEQKNIINLKNNRPLKISVYDSISKTDSIFVLTNQIWKKYDEKSFIHAKDTIYHKKLSLVKIYDKNFRVIDEKKFKFDEDYDNKMIFQISHFLYKYDEIGNLIEKTDFKDGKLHFFKEDSKGKYISEEKINEFEKSFITKFSYIDKNLIEETTYNNNKILFQKKFENKNNYIQKLYYLDTFGKENNDNQPVVIIYKYKFDKYENWTEIIKNVNGKDLYVWKRIIKYY